MEEHSGQSGETVGWTSPAGSGEEASSQALERTLEMTPCCPEDAGARPEKVQGFQEGGVQQPFAGGLQIHDSPDHDSAGQDIC